MKRERDGEGGRRRERGRDNRQGEKGTHRKNKQADKQANRRTKQLIIIIRYAIEILNHWNLMICDATPR